VEKKIRTIIWFRVALVASVVPTFGHPLPLAPFDIVNFSGVAVKGDPGFGSTPDEIVMIAPPSTIRADPEGSIENSTDPDFFVNECPCT
jgi:hypothetical protein